MTIRDMYFIYVLQIMYPDFLNHPSIVEHLVGLQFLPLSITAMNRLM